MSRRRSDESADASPEPVFVPGRHGIRFPSATYAQAFLGLLRAGEVLERRLDTDLRRAHGIGLRGYEILLHLVVFAPEGQLPMTQLTSQAPLSQSRVSRLVAELEAQGLVRRADDERDSRAVVVTITEKGLKRLRQAQETHHRGLMEGLFLRLTGDEIAQLARLTSKLLQEGAT